MSASAPSTTIASAANAATPQLEVRNLNIGQVIDAAERLTAAGDAAAAIRLYQRWIEESRSPQRHLARYNLARMLSEQGDRAAAKQIYEDTLRHKPHFALARVNLGYLLELEGDVPRAVSEWQRALKDLESATPLDRDTMTVVLNNLGRIYEKDKRLVEAEKAMRRSLALNPKQRHVIYHWVRQRQCQCAWPVYAPLPDISLPQMIEATSALAMIGLTDDPEQQLRAAERSVKHMLRGEFAALAPAQGYRHDRLRIGYVSSNFGEHAVSILTAEIYELHDRDRVDVWAFCWSPEDGSAMRARLYAAFDHFVPIGALSDEQAAQVIRAAEIDVLIDLQGLTSGARINVLARRPAPVQITYLGHPGTSGLSCIDYVLCDRYVIPEDQAAFYTERPLYLPDCFQANDRKRKSGPPSNRAQYDLPEDAFVFCAFNNNHKLTPEWFALWMQILERTPNSVLWLLADNDSARKHLEDAAKGQGIDIARLRFAPRVLQDEYLARLALADLFLDCFPFNGGTTVSDALWMGLPVVTRSGRAFASRMAGSLLQAIGAPELITQTDQDYVELAVALAADRPRLAALRQRIADNRDTTPLFDTPRLVKNMEDLFEQVAKRAPVVETVRLAVYTVLIGDKEALCDPRAALPPDATTDLELDFICFTDNRALQSSTWRFIYIDTAHLPPDRLSRRPKALPHEYLPDFDYSLYLDNTVTFKRLPQRADLEPLDEALLRVFAHPTRHNPAEEAEAVAVFGYEDMGVLCRQLEFYARQIPPEQLTPLSSATVILRRHHNAEVKRFGQLWWEQILAFSRRDQISFDYAALKAGCKPSHFAGSKLDNDLISWMQNAAGTRIKASFDPQRYAWQHRGDVEAQRAPKQHFLAKGAPDRAEYRRKLDLFDYICFRQRSSLGSQVSPRRRLSEFVADVLQPYRARSGNLLAIRIDAPAQPYGFLAEELAPAALALSTLLAQHKPHTLDMAFADLLNPALQMNPAPPGFDVLAVFGVPPECLGAAAKLLRLAPAAAGCCLLLASAECRLEQIDALRDAANAVLGAACRVRIAPSYHDGSLFALPNSVLIIEWGAP